MSVENREGFDRRKRLARLVYLLQGAALLFGITYLIAAVISHVQRPKAAGTWLESHFRWQNNTFWFSLIIGVVGALLLTAGPIGIMIISGDLMWVAFRIVQGWIKLSSEKPIGEGPGDRGRRNTKRDDH